MKNKINYINTLLTAFESRNEQLHEEIKRNEQAMEEMRSELTQIMESTEVIDTPEENKLKMAA
ncbi:MAG: hypothetical protein OSJ70_00595 [Bacilli bacterium]|nr:hypothetical protein [Bacilli bacterium]